MTEGQVSLQTLLEPGRTISYGILKTGLFVEAGVPTVQAGSIRNFTVKRSELKTVSESLSNEFSRTILCGGEILVAIRGTVGNVAVANADLIGCNVSREVAVIPIRQGVDEQYVMHMLATRDGQNQIRGYIKGIAQSGINLEDLRRCKVPLPPLEEQRRIAAILDSADALREKRRQALALVEQLTQSVFLEMFGEQLTWAQIRLGEACDVRDGTHDSPKYVAEGYPLVTSKNLTSGRLTLEGASLISVEDYEKINRRSKVDQGDILMPMIGTIGSPVAVISEPFFAIKNVALLKPRTEVVVQRFILGLLASPRFTHFLAQRNRGGTQKFVSLSDLRALTFPLPPLELQQEFSRRVEAIEKLKSAHQQSLKEMDALFASLQHRAFRGEL